MVGPGDPEDETPYYYEYMNYPLWTGGSNYSSTTLGGFIPFSEDIDTFRRTKYITDMVASNQGEGTINPKGVNFDNNAANPWAGGIFAGEGHSQYDPDKNPPGGWIIDPQEHIPCRGFNAITCSLTARARQMWQMQFQDQGIGEETWLPGWGAGMSEAEIMGGLDTVSVGPPGGLFNTPVFLQHNFGNINIGPFKMSDFYNTGHWSVNVVVYEQEEVLNYTTPSIIVTTMFFLGNPINGGYGLKMIGPTGGQLHLGGNPNDPSGFSGETELVEGTNLVGENINVSYPDWGVDVPQGNVTSTPITINTDMEDIGSADAIVTRHYEQVSDNIINILNEMEEAELTGTAGDRV